MQILPGICTVSTYPFGCTYLDNVDCERGSEAFDMSFYLNMGVLGVVWITIVFSMAMIVCLARKELFLFKLARAVASVVVSMFGMRYRRDGKTNAK